MALPAWLAAITQVPAVTPVTVLPETVHTPVVVELKVTGLPEAPPVALTVPVPPTVRLGAAPKLMVCTSSPFPLRRTVAMPSGEFPPIPNKPVIVPALLGVKVT